jgi:hypothetical protein
MRRLGGERVTILLRRLFQLLLLPLLLLLPRLPSGVCTRILLRRLSQLLLLLLLR